MKFYSLVVDDVQQLTSTTLQIDLSIPEALKEVLIWKPGQFLRFQFVINGEILEREYSICTAPYEGYISIAVKKTTHSQVSGYIQEHIKKGGTMLVSAPMGTFGIPSRPNEKRSIVAFSAGSGITPIMSIIKDTLYKEKGVSFYLFYGNSHEKEVIFKKELDSLQEVYPDNFFIHHFYSEQEMKDKLYKGVLDEHKVELIINQLMDWDEVDEALLCGPKEMIITLANAVYKNGIPKKNIHYELYEPIEKVFYDDKIQRSTVKEVKVTFTFEGKTHAMNWINNGSSLLDALLDSGVEAPYSCKGGVCGTCQCTKITGDVILGENLIITEKDKLEGKILTCVAHPQTETLVINMDEQ